MAIDPKQRAFIEKTRQVARRFTDTREALLGQAKEMTALGILNSSGEGVLTDELIAEVAPDLTKQEMLDFFSSAAALETWIAGGHDTNLYRVAK